MVAMVSTEYQYWTDLVWRIGDMDSPICEGGGRKSEVNVLAGKVMRKRDDVLKDDVSKHADLEMTKSCPVT